ERIIRVSLADDLRDEGHEVFEFANAIAALGKMNEVKPEVVITDMKMPGLSGVEFLKKIKERDINICVVLMTAYSTVKTAVEAMKYGAYDYLEKPFDNEKMLLIIKRILELNQMKEENKALKKKLQQNYDFSSYVGNSKEVEGIFDLVKIVASKSTSILLVGETGTGKELLTNIIHFNSNRHNKTLVKVSCAILSREIFESELFGHEKGSFTGAIVDKIGKFELADKGTLYLDDIDDVPLDLQVKLLRALEEREVERVGSNKVIKVDVRLIASTKKDLKKMVDEGKFREDLFYRLNVFPINLPPLRERTKDILLLIKYFVNRFSDGKKIEISPEAEAILMQYPFPGNVRELRNLAERLTLLSEGNNIDVNHIPMEIKHTPISFEEISFDNQPLNKIIEEVERKAIKFALEKAGGNKAKAAERLGLPASTLKSKIARFEE
ncbi:MAG: sigma-54-dependent Fis family transcriptional regulator, partial [Bacteroidetes bacterium]